MTRTLFSLLLFGALFAAGGSTRTQAQTSAEPQLFITWRASKSYAPSWYRGKILPTTGSRISASASIIEGGKLADLSGETIYWYVNGSFLSGGVGATTASFIAPGRAPNRIDLRAQLPSYKGSLTLSTIEIPMVLPSVAIESRYPGGAINGTATLEAHPFFFSVARLKDLAFGWRVGSEDVSGSEDPATLSLTPQNGTQIGATFPVAVTVKNPIRFDEVATQNITLTFRSP